MSGTIYRAEYHRILPDVSWEDGEWVREYATTETDYGGSFVDEDSLSVAMEEKDIPEGAKKVLASLFVLLQQIPGGFDIIVMPD